MNFLRGMIGSGSLSLPMAVKRAGTWVGGKRAESSLQLVKNATQRKAVFEAALNSYK
jgi:hypothetical protein